MKSKLPKPIKKQREVLYMPATGHSAVLGTAGSGKTTLALYRSAYLSAPNMPHTGKTLLLTFNRALVTYLNYLKPSELRNVKIEHYHKFARGYLNSRGRMTPRCICEEDLRRKLIAQAISNIANKYEPSKFFKRPLEFYFDEITWILSHGIMEKITYKKVERIGRVGTNLARVFRDSMYEILQEYLRLRKANGKQYDWDDIAYYLRLELNGDDSKRLYTHIVIDEGQDFSPEMLRSLAAAIPPDGSLTFFGDVAQQIYGQRMSWSSANLKIPKKWEFKENYRNTKQIAKLGLAISQMPYFEGIVDLVEPSEPIADGSPPTIVSCKNNNQQIDISVRTALDAAKTQKVAILVKNREQEKLFISILGSKATKLHRDLTSWQEGPCLYHGTYHSAKGLEFDTVILPFLDADNLPDQDHIVSYGEDDALTHDGRLLYVAVTRAKTNLIILYNQNITPLLPKNRSLFKILSHDTN